MDKQEANKAGALTKKICPSCQKEFPKEAVKCLFDGSELLALPSESLIGTTFADKYEILSVLGQGGMSIVYKARHKFMDRVVALKLLHDHLLADELAIQRFQREAKAASSLSHQNIVSVHDFGRTNSGQTYFVMDCLEGESLADLLERDDTVELNRAVDIFKQACDGLEHAHKKGVIHRDLKPSNLVLISQEDGSDLVKIVDFGIAKVMPQQGKPQQQLTQTGEIFGSPLYMSPEQCNGRPMDIRSDIYSFGCLMYETLSGVPPLMGDSFINTVVKHLNEAPPPFERTAPTAGIPPAVEAVIMRCLEKEPQDRFSTAAELRQSLLDAALDCGVSGLRTGAVPDPAARAALGSTWDKIKNTLGTGNTVIKKKSITVAQILFGGIPLLTLIAIAIIMLVWQGPEGDRGTLWDKMLWQINISRAQKAYAEKNYIEAKDCLLAAKKNAMTFVDGHSRLQYTEERLADVFGKCGLFAEQERANQTIANILTEQVMAQARDTKAKLKDLASASQSGVETTMNQLEAEANANRVMLCSKRLSSRGLYSQQESLLREAIRVFEHLRIHENDQVADFKTALADCLSVQQRMLEVRPLLIDALKIREQNLDKTNPTSLRKLIGSYLKLGQFDRDQSSYERSQSELEKALSMTREYFKDDKKLTVESLNSYADLLRQTGKMDEYNKTLAEARALGKTIVDDPAQDMPPEPSPND